MVVAILIAPAALGDTEFSRFTEALPRFAEALPRRGEALDSLSVSFCLPGASFPA